MIIKKREQYSFFLYKCNIISIIYLNLHRNYFNQTILLGNNYEDFCSKFRIQH